MYTLLLKSAHVVTPHEISVRDVALQEGKIVKIAERIDVKAKREIDCSNLFLLPGLIDIHVHMRDPYFPHKEDFATGSRAAAAGGITSFIDMPNTQVPTTTRAELEKKQASAAQKSIVNYGFFFGLTDSNFEEAERAARAIGVAGFKAYLAHGSGDMVIQNLSTLERALQLGRPLVVHAEDEAIIKKNKEAFGSRHDPAVHSEIRSGSAAYEAARHVLHLAKKWNARVHLTHVSTAGEIEEIKKFKSSGIVSCDVTPHHLFLNDTAYDTLGNFAKMNPPLRSESDRLALWKGIEDRIIDMIATDHAPHTREEKEQPYEKAPSGVPGLETMLPLLLDAVNHGQITLQEIAWLCSEGPARIFKIKNKGRVEEGYDADLVLVDMNAECVVENGKLQTKCKWSPFAGMRLRGWPHITIVSGEAVFENGVLLAKMSGRALAFE